MRIRWAVLLGLMLAARPVGADGVSRFRFWKELDRRASNREEILAVPLDRDIYASTREGFPDLRILDEKGAEVPYALERAEERQTRRVREACASEVVSLRELDGKALEIVVRLAEKAPNARGVTVISPLTDYEHRVRVSGSKNGEEWSPLTSDGLIFDYTRHMDVRNGDIPLPDNTSRWFKLVVEQVLDERESPFRELTRSRRGGREDRHTETTVIERRPFRIDRIDPWRTVEVEGAPRASKTTYPIDAFRVEEDAEQKVTRIHVPSRREPITGFILETPSRNFSRAVSVRVPARRGPKAEWVEVGRGTIHRIAFHSFRREGLRLDFPERRESRYQIVIDNEDNPPLEIAAVEAEGNIDRLIFLASGARRYRIAYGSDTAGPPRYETATVLAPLRRGFRPVEARPGVQAANPRYRTSTGLRDVLNSPIVLGAVVVLMVAVLGWILLRAGRRIKQLPVDEVG